MKKTRRLKLLCAILGIVTLLSALPLSAETATENTADELFSIAVNFEAFSGIYNKVLVGSSIKEQYTNNADVTFYTPKDLGGNNIGSIQYSPGEDSKYGEYSLQITSGSSWFAVQDINQKLNNGDFVVSADVYLTLANFTADKQVHVVLNNADQFQAIIEFLEEEKAKANAKKVISLIREVS